MKRRTLLAGGAAALVVTPAAAICQGPVAIADPASAFVGAYRAALAHWLALPPECQVREPAPCYERGVDSFPIPISSDGARDLLMLLIEDAKEGGSDDDDRYILLAEAVITYLEGAR